MKRLILLIAALLTTGAVAFSAVEQEEKQNPKQLLGTWRMVSAKYNGQEANFPATETMVKHVTPEQFTWVVYDRRGRVSSVLGGPIEIKDDNYAETAEYGANADHLLRQTHRYKWKIEGNRWIHQGTTAAGTIIDEVWERVAKK
jgi:hypothetical protein